MDWASNVTNVIIGIGTGLISGYISGVFVTSKFNKKEKELKWKMELGEERQNMVRYLDLVQFELDLIKEDMENDNPVDYKRIGTLLINEPITSNTTEDKVTEISLKNISAVRKLINEIRKDIDSKTLTLNAIRMYDSRFGSARFYILNIEPK